ncbi:toll/interleukin-1 receptor domain-containing protein [Stenoxybacter acetivorans]|uniref:toll/interleukin-1 receptor domain-containing protein n=1 Tax=Stenoxybacter acetivorans TaxID=422441 RepID=UPI00068AA5D0|nr:toll/interleukin-1 receptor domain-containing protein [Stenoxybacter acetivorans]
MSAEQTRKTINQLDKDIVLLEKKSADYSKKEAMARSSAARVAKGTPKNASLATIKSKQSRIEKFNTDAIRAVNARADIDKKIADKRKKRAEAQVKLQKEEVAERKKNDKAQVVLQQNYEQRIDELTGQIQAQAVTQLQQHLYAATAEEEYDVFISHASEDKESFVDDLYQELDSRGVKVWYDAMSIKWGDSLRSKIDEGLRKSRFGIVILSNDFIRKGWTQYELDGLFQREMTGGKTILPIWHKITKDEVQTFSPPLAGRKALNTATLSAEEIAIELISLLPPVEIEEATEELEETTNG